MPTEAPRALPEWYDVMNWLRDYTRTAVGVTYGAMEEHFLGPEPSSEDAQALRSLTDALRGRADVVLRTKPVYRSAAGWTQDQPLTEDQERVLHYVKGLTAEVGGSCVAQEIIPFNVDGKREAERALYELVNIGALTSSQEETWKVFDLVADGCGDISG